jgi:hypothetical protein
MDSGIIDLEILYSCSSDFKADLSQIFTTAKKHAKTWF